MKKLRMTRLGQGIAAAWLTMFVAMSVQAATMSTTPELLKMWRSGEQEKMAYVIGYVTGVLDDLTGESGVCLEDAVGKTIPEIAASIMKQTEADYSRRLANIKKVEKTLGSKAPSLGASADVVISARQIFKCK